MMSQAAFERKYQSYITFLERKLNGYPRCQYGRTRAHKALLAEGKPLPPFQEIDIRCHDFRVTFCTTCYNAGISPKTIQVWMVHADTKLVMDVYTKLTAEKEQADALRLNRFLCRLTTKGQETGEEKSGQTLVGQGLYAALYRLLFDYHLTTCRP